MNRDWKVRFGLFCVLLAVLTSLAGAEPKKQPFKSSAARAAYAKHELAKDRATRQYLGALKQAKAEYTRALTSAQTIATKANQLDEAVAIRDALEKLKAQAKSPKPKIEKKPQSKHVLVGTTWRPSNLADPRRRTFYAKGTWDDGGKSQTPSKPPATGIWREVSKDSYALWSKHTPTVRWVIVVTGDTLTFQAPGTPKYVWTKVK